MPRLKMPDFETDAEEAAWWFNNQDEIAREAIEDMGKEILLVDAEDAQLGKSKAAASGMSYEIYMAQLLHRALHEQEAA